MAQGKSQGPMAPCSGILSIHSVHKSAVWNLALCRAGAGLVDTHQVPLCLLLLLLLLLLFFFLRKGPTSSRLILNLLCRVTFNSQVLRFRVGITMPNSCGAGDPTQGFTHAWQALYQLGCVPVQLPLLPTPWALCIDSPGNEHENLAHIDASLHLTAKILEPLRSTWGFLWAT